jgi:DUF4097 and DUF4098 domain-containing protein YvlB
MRIVLSFVALMTAAGLAPAQTVGPVERQRGFWVQSVAGELPAGAEVRIETVGPVRVLGSEGRQVRYRIVKRVRAGSEREAQQLLGQARLRAERQGAAVVLSLDDPGCRRCAFSAEMSVETPRETARAVLDTSAGSLDVRGLSGNVSAETAGGSIVMDDIGGEVQAATAGGAIQLGRVAGRVRCETAGGPIRLGNSGGPAELRTSGGGIEAGQVGGDLRAETAGGNIRADRVTGNIIAATSGGSIHVGEVSGSVDAETAGGSIHVDSAPRGVRAETAGGGIDLNNVGGKVIATSASGPIRAFFVAGRLLGDSLLETTGGTIVVWLPANLAVRVDAVIDFAGGSNRFQSEFDSITVQRSEDGFGPGRVVAGGEINGGGPVLRIRNTNGRIQIQKRP